MANKTWKAVERRIARKLGARRVVCSGVRGEGDVIHDKYHIDVKHRKKIPFMAEWRKNKKEAEALDKISLIVIHEKGSRTNLVILDFDDFVDLTGGVDKDVGV